MSEVLSYEGFHSGHAATKIKISDRHRQTRVEWVIFYQQNLDWEKAIFVDEYCFSSEKDGIMLVRRPKNTRYNPELVNYTNHCQRKLVSVFAVISCNGASPLVQLDRRLNSSVYTEILDTVGVDFIKDKFSSSECYWLEDRLTSQ